MSSIMRKINMLSRCGGIYRADRLEGSELNPCHHAYVFAVCNNPGMSQEEIAKHILINKSNVARHLLYLEQHGYVERKADENDRHISRVYPTQKMIDILPTVRSVTKDFNEYLAEDLTQDEFAQFQNILERLVKKAEDYMASREDIK